jgi:hypothetical protein
MTSEQTHRQKSCNEVQLIFSLCDECQQKDESIQLTIELGWGKN